MLQIVFFLTKLSSAVKYYNIVTILFLLFYNIVIFRSHIYLDISVVIPRALHGYEINHILWLLKKLWLVQKIQNFSYFYSNPQQIIRCPYRWYYGYLFDYLFSWYSMQYNIANTKHIIITRSTAKGEELTVGFFLMENEIVRLT